MRYLVLLMMLLIPIAGVSAHTETPPPPDPFKLIHQISAFGVTVYYPNIMSAVIDDEIVFHFEDDSTDTFIITPPQTLADIWGIRQSDLAMLTADVYDVLTRNHADTVTFIQQTPIRIQDYRANYFVLQHTGVYTLIVYVFETPHGIFSARLQTHEANYASKTDLILRILKAMTVSSPPTEDIISRTAPIPDVRMGERITSIDQTVTYQMPFGWVLDNTSAEADLIADSQTMLDLVNDEFNIPKTGIAIGIITPRLMDELGFTATTPRAIIQEFQTAFVGDENPSPTWYYDNLPYAVYIEPLDATMFEYVYMVAMTPPSSDAVMLLFVFTQDFDRDEPYVIAVMNSIQLTNR